MDGQTLTAIEFQGGLGQLLIGCRQESGQGLDDGDFSSQATPHAAQLEPDDACPDDAQALGHGIERQGSCGVHDQLVIERGAGQLDWHRTRGDDDMGCLQLVCAFIHASKRDPALLDQLAMTMEDADLVGAHQARHTACELAHHLVLAGLHGLEVQLEPLGIDAMLLPVAMGCLPQCGGFQQRLGGNAAHVEAGTAQ